MDLHESRLKYARSILSLLPVPTVSEEARGGAPRTFSDHLEFDAAVDTRHSNRHPGFDRVVHVFHQSWHGIRSACGALPGHKIAVPVEPKLPPSDLARLLSRASEWDIEKAVFHGFSLNALAMLRLLRKEGVDCYLVWHGNVAQLAWGAEARFYELALESNRQGRFRRTHVLKRGHAGLFDSSFEPMLLNQPPQLGLGRLAPPFGLDTRTALVPAYVDIRKNVHASLLACASTPALDRILHYAPLVAKPPGIERCTRVEYKGHGAHLDLLRQVDIVVNVTLVDCHPMVDLEALGAGTPAMTGRLFLDALEDHPYTRLTEVENPFDIPQISRRIASIAAMPAAEVEQLVTDYSAALRAVSAARYGEFLFG